jgi:hypothetical protein
MPRKSPRIEPEFKYDYILYISKEFDDVKRQKFLKFLLETTQHFLAFNYDIDVDVKIEDKKLTFKILGFKPPSSPISQFGPARFEYRLYEYSNGTYTLTIVKKENIKNTYSISIIGDKISLKSSPRKNKFVKINILN